MEFLAFDGSRTVHAGHMEQHQAETSQCRVPKPSSFQFVTFQDMHDMRDAANLSRIRKHAMREIGVSRRRRSNFRRRPYEKIPLEVLVEFPLPSPAATGFGEGAIDPFARFPIELDDFGRELVVNIFREGPRALRDDWFTVCLASPHTFNQLLSNEAVHVNKLRLRDESSLESTRSVRYHLDALIGIRTELQLSTVTDGVVGTVAGFLVYAYATASEERIYAHLKGLLGLLSAYKGGLDALERNAPLRSTVSWGDIRSAYLQDRPCRLPAPQKWLEEADLLFKKICRTQAGPVLPSLLQSVDIQESLGREFVDIVQFVLTCSEHTKLDVSDANIAMDRLNLPHWVNVAIYRLLSLRPLETADQADDDPTGLVLSESLRVALLLVLAQVWIFYGAHPVHTEVLVWEQYDLLKGQSVIAQQDKGFRTLQLWIVSMSAFEAVRLPDQAARRWFVQAVADLTVLEIDLLETLQEVLWLPLLFEQQLNDLQQEVLLLR